MTDSTVTFTAKDYKTQGHWKEVTLSGEEFIRRFLMHVPPKHFVRIRHYGLLSSRNRIKDHFMQEPAWLPKVYLKTERIGCTFHYPTALQ